MEFLNTWVQQIVVAVIIATVIEMILPNGNNKKYVKIVLGIYVVFNIMAPIVNKITNNNFEISSIINIDKYAKEFETYTVSSRNADIEGTNKKYIKEVYISNLQTDIKTKLKDKGFITKKIEIILEDGKEYDIKEIVIELEGKKDEDEDQNKIYNEGKNEVVINQIETVNINISNNSGVNKEKIENEKEDKMEKVTYVEKTEIIKYISDIYGVNEKKITIY